MAIGRGPSEAGGVIDPADVRGAGNYEWAQMTGVPVDHPLVSDSQMPFTIGSRWSRVVTTPLGQSGPASDTLATPEVSAALRHFDSWRDVFNFHGSAVPWLLLVALLVISVIHFGVSGEASGFGRHIKAGAAYG